MQSMPIQWTRPASVKLLLLSNAGNQPILGVLAFAATSAIETATE
jgi:hypothetical protein